VFLDWQRRLRNHEQSETGVELRGACRIRSRIMTQASSSLPWVGAPAPLSAMSETNLPRRFYSEAHSEWQEDVPCPWCQGCHRRVVINTVDRVYHRPGSYPVVRCDDCGLLYVTPRPTFESLAHHYPDDYFCYLTPEDYPGFMRASIQKYNDELARQRISLIEKCIGTIPRGTSVLDVGCGIGDLLANLEQQRACEVRGIDFKDSAVASARLTRHLNVDQATLTEAGYDSARFDLVTMIEYLEHESDPRAILNEARRILKPGGHLVLEIPDPTAWPARLFRNNWWNLHVPRHLVLFSPQTLDRALTELGFESIEIRPFTMPYNMGTNLFQAIGMRYNAKRHWQWIIATAALGFTLVPLSRWMPEFLMVTARVPR
jgi:ubiquinone/menaquinone biosynthesis C-methylase UbiE